MEHLPDPKEDIVERRLFKKSGNFGQGHNQLQGRAGE